MINKLVCTVYIELILVAGEGYSRPYNQGPVIQNKPTTRYYERPIEEDEYIRPSRETNERFLQSERPDFQTSFQRPDVQTGFQTKFKRPGLQKLDLQRPEFQRPNQIQRPEFQRPSQLQRPEFNRQQEIVTDTEFQRPDFQRPPGGQIQRPDFNRQQEIVTNTDFRRPDFQKRPSRPHRPFIESTTRPNIPELPELTEKPYRRPPRLAQKPPSEFISFDESDEEEITFPTIPAFRYSFK